MSIKSLLMPAIIQRRLSRQYLLKQRAAAEKARVARREPHRVYYFHQVDDPYSALTASVLQRLLDRYDIELTAHVVGPPPDAAAPQREKLMAYSRRDCHLLARRYGLPFPESDTSPADDAVETAAALLVTAIREHRFVEFAGKVSACLWNDPGRLKELAGTSALSDLASGADVAAHRQAANALRERFGHYLGAMFFYGGEWYWGIDRLHHLERRLQELGVHRHGESDLMLAPGVDLATPASVADPPAIDFFFSFRSPYSAIVAQRVFELGRLTGAPVRLRFVLPMIMRGLPLPSAKRMYIVTDAAREAHLRGIEFGRIQDPIGRPTERGLSLIPYAQRMGRGQEYVLAFIRGVWTQGIDAGSDRGLKKIVTAAGLSWPEAQAALADDSWRETAERNRAELFSLGLWGVPSFRAGNVAVWGQDRLWAIEEALLGLQRESPPASAATSVT